MSPTIKIGILGMGTVARGTIQVLQRNATEISRRAGRAIEISRIASRTITSAQQYVGPDVQIGQDLYAVTQDPDIDIVLELMGGVTTARDLIIDAIKQGKHVVTANKALLALHGNEIFALAQEKGVMVAFEAAVAGGIPIIKALREGLTANRIEWIAGIINGTSNYILSEMRNQGLSFAEALQAAQALGYAEADPTFDIDGQDAAHKLTIIAAIAFGIPVQYEQVYIEGIRQLHSKDIRYAETLGYRIKLLGITQRTAQGIQLRVHPTLIATDKLIANVEGVMNAILVKGDAIGPSLYYGAGAGAEPTASAVIADIADIIRLHTAHPEHRVPHLAFQPSALSNLPILSIDAIETRAYLRLHAQDRPGVLAEVTRILAEENISIDAMLQKTANDNGYADIIILTHIALEKNINTAINHIEALPSINGPAIRLRAEAL